MTVVNSLLNLLVQPYFWQSTLLFGAGLLLLPAIVLLVAFTHWPAIATLVDSLYATPHGSRPAPFVGVDNYARVFADPLYWSSFWRTAYFVAAFVAGNAELSRA